MSKKVIKDLLRLAVLIFLLGSCNKEEKGRITNINLIRPMDVPANDLITFTIFTTDSNLRRILVKELYDSIVFCNKDLSTSYRSIGAKILQKDSFLLKRFSLETTPIRDSMELLNYLSFHYTPTSIIEVYSNNKRYKLSGDFDQVKVLYLTSDQIDQYLGIE